MLQKPNLPLPCFLGEKPLYVNAKQFYRILKLRLLRAKRAMKHSRLNDKDKYRYESRHQHAKSRVRNDKGRFISKTESTEEDEKKQVEVNEKGNFEHEGNYKGRNVKKKSECEEYSTPNLQNFGNFELDNSEWYCERPNQYFDEAMFLNNQEDLLHIDTDQIQNFFESRTPSDREELPKHV